MDENSRKITLRKGGIHEKTKFILMASGLVMLFGVTTLLILQRHPVDAESYDRNEVNAVVEPTPTPVGSFFSDIVIQKENVTESSISPRTKEELAEEVLAQYNWEDRENEKSMFHLVLLCTDNWLSKGNCPLTFLESEV